MTNIAPYLKAVAGGVAAGIGALLLVVTGNETVADVTFAEWLLVVLAVLGSFGIVSAVPTRSKPE